MRKILLPLVMSVVMTITLLAQPVLARMPQIPESYDFDLQMRLNLDIQGSDIDSEAEAFLAFLRNVVINAKGTVVMDRENFLATHMYAEVSIRAGLFYIPFNIWMDMDFTDAENIVYLIIVELPEMLQALIGLSDPALARQFWVMDYAPLFEEFPEYMDMIRSMNSTFDFSAIMGMMPEMEAIEANKYRTSLNDDEFSEYLINIIEIGIDTAINQVLGSMDAEEAELMTAEIHEELEEITDRLFALLRKVTFLSEDWISYYVLDENGYAVSEDTSLKLIFDIREWADAISYVYPNAFRLGFGAPAPDIVVTLGIEYTITYENINTAQRVPPMAFTPDNSVDIFGLWGF
ncbi:MAG: hypothetical protein FWE24_03675 [Defluviitaleaceae bacterium]|nr:hypothetical protein [Defluviitaleaceae bacterium]